MGRERQAGASRRGGVVAHVVSYRGRSTSALATPRAKIAPEALGQLFIEKVDVTWDSVQSDFSLDEIDPDVWRFSRLARPRLPQVSEDEPAESVLRELKPAGGRQTDACCAGLAVR